MDAVRGWSGPRPSEFGLCEPEEDLAVMVAVRSVRGRMAAWEHQVQQAELDRLSTRRSLGPPPR